MSARALMFQGTGSDVGKSLIVAGLCRALSRSGTRVVPFKPQNMSNNAAVTDEGGEIGRAQWLQAFAAGVNPSVHMNPVLLKPQSDRTCQVIVQGQLHSTQQAGNYMQQRGELLEAVTESYHTLAESADLILIEGAGSPAEVNLRARDIANMGFAEAVDCPVVLIGDIDRGGVIASLTGTHTLLSDSEKKRIRAFLINKFRGDIALFDDGVKVISEHTKWKHLGTIPYFHSLWQLPQEDALTLEQLRPSASNEKSGKLHVVMLVTPRLSNFDDVDPLRGEPDIKLTMLRAGEVLPADTDLVIIAGSKSTMDDLAFIRSQGWDVDIKAHIRRGGHVLGICAGYQILGKTLKDPAHVESRQSETEGLGLLDVVTVYESVKRVRRWTGSAADARIHTEGYEIHMGVTTGVDCANPLLRAENGSPEGAISHDGHVMGTSVHGLLASDAFRHHLLSRITNRERSRHEYLAKVDAILNEWADLLEQHIDMEQLLMLPEKVPSAEKQKATARKPSAKKEPVPA